MFRVQPATVCVAMCRIVVLGVWGYSIILIVVLFSFFCSSAHMTVVTVSIMQRFTTTVHFDSGIKKKKRKYVKQWSLYDFVESQTRPFHLLICFYFLFYSWSTSVNKTPPPSLKTRTYLPLSFLCLPYITSSSFLPWKPTLTQSVSTTTMITGHLRCVVVLNMGYVHHSLWHVILFFWSWEWVGVCVYTPVYCCNDTAFVLSVNTVPDLWLNKLYLVGVYGNL